jgi:hypothetical protein
MTFITEPTEAARVPRGEHSILSPSLNGASALQKTVAAIIPDWPLIDATVRTELAIRCANLVRKQISLAPFYSRMGFRALFVGYRAFTIICAGLSPSSVRRKNSLYAFSRLPLPMAATLERVLRSTTFLFYFEQPEVLEALHEETITARQVAYRLKRDQVLSQ